MPTSPLNNPANLPVIYRTTIATGADDTVFFPLDPRRKTAVMAIKGGETATISLTTDTRNAGTANTATRGTRITDIETANYFDVSSDDLNYFAGDNASLSAIKVNANPVTNPVKISIIQF